MSALTGTTNGTDLIFTWTPPAGATNGTIAVTNSSGGVFNQSVSSGTITFRSVPLEIYTAVVTYGTTTIGPSSPVNVDGKCNAPIDITSDQVITYTTDGFTATILANVLASTDPTITITNQTVKKTGLSCGKTGTISLVDAMSSLCTYTISYAMPACPAPAAPECRCEFDCNLIRLIICLLLVLLWLVMKK